MTFLDQDLSPFLLAIIIASGFWFARMKASDRTKERVRQLSEAAELLKCHGSVLERFLNAPQPDADLKRLLIWFSDSMADRAVVEKLTEWSASREFAYPMEELKRRDEFRSP